MAKEIKQYDYNELQQLDTDELLRLYNRTAERVNKQVTRLKNAGIYDETAALYDVQRAPVYRTERAKNRALQNVEQLTEDILSLQERGRGEITTSVAAKEIIDLKREAVIMLKGSHIGGAQLSKAQMDEFWKMIKPSDLAIIKRAKEYFSANSNSRLFYEIQRRLVVNGNDMPQFDTMTDVREYINSAMDNIPSNELPLSEQAATIAKMYTKRF